MSDEKIIRFPSGDRARPGGATKRPAGAAPTGLSAASAGATAAGANAPTELAGLSADQQKAIGLIVSGHAFVLVALAPTTTGCDFFTAVHGEAAELRNAQPHIDAVISRAFGRKGI